MSQGGIRQPVVLGVAPIVQGIGFAVFSGPWVPVDWGIKRANADKNRRSRAAVAALIE